MRSFFLRFEGGFSREILSKRISRKIVIEGPVFLKDDHKMLDGSRGIRTSGIQFVWADPCQKTKHSESKDPCHESFLRLFWTTMISLCWMGSKSLFFSLEELVQSGFS